MPQIRYTGINVRGLLTNLTVQKLKLDAWRSCECFHWSVSTGGRSGQITRVRQRAQRHEQTGVDVSEKTTGLLKRCGGGGDYRLVSDRHSFGAPVWNILCDHFEKVWKGFLQKETVAIRVTPRRERKKKKRQRDTQWRRSEGEGVSLYSDHIITHDRKILWFVVAVGDSTES